MYRNWKMILITKRKINQRKKIQFRIKKRLEIVELDIKLLQILHSLKQSCENIMNFNLINLAGQKKWTISSNTKTQLRLKRSFAWLHNQNSTKISVFQTILSGNYYQNHTKAVQKKKQKTNYRPMSPMNLKHKNTQ